MRKKSIVLLSGGLDSSANLAFCAAMDSPVLALTANYGQKAAQREVDSARQLAEYYGVRHQWVDLSWLGKLGGSSLTDASKPIPQLETYQLDEMQITQGTAQAVWVPNRNGVLIAMAASFAETEGADQVVVGFNIEEAATFPDNSSEFLRRSSEALILSTRSSVRVFSYTDRLNKKQIVQSLRKLEKTFPFEMVWSCYEGGSEACGKCESCRRLKRALEETEPVSEIRTDTHTETQT